jgi:hypothetical protein
MRFLRSLLALFILVAAHQAFAGYAYPKPPAGISTLPGGGVGFGGAAAAGTFASGKITTNVVVQVAGSAVTVPAALRLASNAGQYAIAAARLNPAGLAVGALATWLLSEGIQYTNSRWEKTGNSSYAVGWSTSIWGTSISANNTITCAIESLESCVQGQVEAMQAAHNAGAGCGTSCITDYIFGEKDTLTKWVGTYPNAVTAYKFQYWTRTGTGSWVFQANYTVSITGGTTTRVPNDADFAVAGNRPLSDAAANQIYPTVVLPVDVAINPDGNFVPQGYRVPTGAPSPISPPGTYRQPVTDIYPSPEPGIPYRVDLKPQWLENGDPVGITVPESITPSSPASKDPATADSTSCGLPGTPACKIDETGTAAGPGATVAATQTAFDAAATAMGDGITNAGNRSSLPFTFGFSMPTGSCAPLVMTNRWATITFDACTNQNVQNFRQAWGYILGIFAMLYMWRSAIEIKG